MKTIDIINELLELPTKEDIIRRLKELKTSDQDGGDAHSKDEAHHVYDMK